MDQPAGRSSAALDAALADLGAAFAKPEIVPEGFHTAREWATLSDASESHTRRKLQRLVESGEWERREFRIPVSGRKGLLPIPHYRRQGAE